MALRRRQQKLVGFGPRWQHADPTTALDRVQEVLAASRRLDEVYDEQKRVQEHAETECVATVSGGEHSPRQKWAVLTKRRGQAVESFGSCEDGKWWLAPEEALYLAERGTLSVWMEGCRPTSSVADSTCDESKRRLSILELYEKALQELSLAAYVTYAYLRRAGLRVQRPSPELATPELQRAAFTGPWLAIGALPHRAASSLRGVRTEHMVHVTSPKDTLKYVLPVLLPSNNIEMGQVVAVVDACSGLAFMDIGAPRASVDNSANAATAVPTTAEDQSSDESGDSQGGSKRRVLQDDARAVRAKKPRDIVADAWLM
mmetsp:Transcript_56223/g.131686  ORF Transcript_56223/g.131686 Transcript_56223/m.131686 type:complete len:316 (+) Transcript_56223:70-1017(+)